MGAHAKVNITIIINTGRIRIVIVIDLMLHMHTNRDVIATTDADTIINMKNNNNPQ